MKRRYPAPAGRHIKLPRALARLAVSALLFVMFALPALAVAKSKDLVVTVGVSLQLVRTDGHFYAGFGPEMSMLLWEDNGHVVNFGGVFGGLYVFGHDHGHVYAEVEALRGFVGVGVGPRIDLGGGGKPKFGIQATVFAVPIVVPFFRPVLWFEDDWSWEAGAMLKLPVIRPKFSLF